MCSTCTSPRVFLPENYPLLIKTDRALRTPGGPKPARSGRSSWVLKPNSPFLVDSSGSSLSKFDFKSLRSKEDYPSVFSLLVNANLQLQSVKQRTNNDILHTYISSIQDALAAIFHVPRQVHSQASHQTPPASDSEDEDESDTINGLTFPEMEAVMQRVSDGSISDQERVEAAMVMLGMAGGKPSIHHTALLSL